MITSDYQQFERRGDHIRPVGSRLQIKLARIPLPDLQGKSVLDVGCHSGFWCYVANQRGAKTVVGLDQNPIDSPIEDQPFAFHVMQLGKQWREYGRFDVVLLLSVYHHLYEAAGGDHEPIWFWLSRQIKPDGVLVAEIAITAQDHTVQSHVSKEYHKGYFGWTAAAERYFQIESVGPAVHETLRHIYRLKPKVRKPNIIECRVEDGHGLASVLMEYEHDRRKHEIEKLLGMSPYPGTLNMRGGGFDWDSRYFRGEILALQDRKQKMAGGFRERWIRFYPVTINGQNAFAARFENEYHPTDFIELIAPVSLRRTLGIKTGDKVTLCCA